MRGQKYLKGACQHCGGHIEFPAEIVGTPTPCPHCGQHTELLLARPAEESGLPLRVILWTVAAIVVLLAGLAGSLFAVKRAQRLVERQRQHAPAMAAPVLPTNAPEVADAIKNGVEQNDFAVSEIMLDKAAGTSLVYGVGTVRNAANRQRFGVKIQLALFDVSGQKVGTATEYRQVLEPNAEWHFKALVVDSKAVSAKLEWIKED